MVHGEQGYSFYYNIVMNYGLSAMGYGPSTLDPLQYGYGLWTIDYGLHQTFFTNTVTSAKTVWS